MSSLSDSVPHSYLQIDLEGTGLGKVNGKMFANDVHVWQIGYSLDREAPKSIMAALPHGVQFEQEAVNIYGKDVVGGVPGLYARQVNKQSERGALDEFHKVLKSNPNTILEGWNIRRYDIPLLEHAFKRHGMTEAIDTLKSTKYADHMDYARDLLLARLSPEAKTALFGDSVDTDTYPVKGTSLKVFAEGFGIETADMDLHDAREDIKLFEMVKQKMFNNPDSFDPMKWAQAVDRSGHKEGQSFESRLRGVEKYEQELDPTRLQFKYQGPSGPEDEWYDYTDTSKVPPAPEAPTSLGAKPIPVDKGTPKKNWFGKIGDDIFDSFEDPKVQKFGLIGLGVLGAAYLAKEFSNDSDLRGSDYISATSLGKPEEDILKAIRSSKNVQQYNKAIAEDTGFEEANRLRSGDEIHKMIEKEIQRSDIGYSSEVNVQDKELGIKGVSDSVVEIDGQKYPVEIKSTSVANLDAMTEANPAHASQANFYSHALKSPGGWVMYVGSDDPSVRKSFYIPYSPGKLIQDVAKFRETVIKHQEEPGVLHGWAKQMREYFRSSNVVPAGIRSQVSSESSYNGFEVMNAHPEYGFPGGRSQLFRKTLHAVFGLSDEFLEKSKISIKDSEILKSKTFEDWESASAQMRDYRSSVPGVYEDFLTRIHYIDDPMKANIEPNRVIKPDGQIIRGYTISVAKGDIDSLAHEMLELSEKYSQLHRLRALPLVDNMFGEPTRYKGLFGTHNTTTVISEETRLAKAFGDKAYIDQQNFRGKELTGYKHNIGAIEDQWNWHTKKKIKDLFAGKKSVDPNDLFREAQLQQDFLNSRLYVEKMERMGFMDDVTPPRFYQLKHQSKIKDQVNKNSHLFPGGTPSGGNTVANRSRQDRRN